MKFAFGAVGILAALSAFSVFAEEEASASAPPIVEVPVLSDDVREELKKSQEEHQYQAEVTRLMDIIINSLYTQRDVFLRELISNSVDALEKARFLGIKNPAIKEFAEFEIRVAADQKNNVISICDTGIGMTKHELVNNLGTIAKSGTSNFLESLGQNNDVNLIGQFGVGFYSAFLVADRVTVISKTATDDQYIWESSADAKYYVTKDPRGNTLKRGTCILLHMKSDATEFFNQDKLRELVKRYSQFISFPIRLLVTRKVYEDVPVDETEEEGKEKTSEDSQKEDSEDVQVKDAEETQESKPKTKKVAKDVQEWEQLNEQKAIWLRNKDEITQEEYNSFYKALTRDWSEPLTQIHFSAEGEVEFKALLFIPKIAPHDMIGQYFSKSTAVRLYVRRVLVADAFDDLIPKYLSFIRGVVDSDDLPLNVSREQLQQSKILKIISTKVTRKTLDTVRKMFLDSEKEREELQEQLEAPDLEADKKAELQRKMDDTPFMRFYNQYGRNLLLGCYEDDASKSRIAKVLLFKTLKHPDSPISLERYVKEMQEGQKSIYYAAGGSVQEIAQQPTLQVFKKKGLDVLYLLESMDEPCLQKLQSFDGKTLESVQKGNVQLGETEEEVKAFRRLKKHFQPLTSWFSKVLGEDRVYSVVLSKRLVEAPCAIVATEWGLSAQMEKVLKSQTFADRELGFRTQKMLELNPHHTIIQKLLDKVKEGDGSAGPEEEAVAKQLFDTAMMASGFETDNRSQLANIIYKELAKEVGVPPQESLVNELVLPADENEPEEVSEDTSSMSSEDILKNLGMGMDDLPKDEL